MPPPTPFHENGTVTDTLNVRLSYRIIQLFSEGLYSSPNKALEELVTNSFDAGATNVHLILDPDLTATDAAIAVVDNGSGMDIEDLQQHWIVGASQKRDASYVSPMGRRPIGKFGIGKLASYVLANRLTHITKKAGRYYSTTMDYTVIPDTPLGTVIDSENNTADKQTVDGVKLDVRELTPSEAKSTLARWTSGPSSWDHPALFGRAAPKGWTVAVLSDLKPMAGDIRLGRLRYVLSTAMPIRDDFQLFQNGQQVEPFKIDRPKLGEWTLGRDLVDIPSPAPQDLDRSNDPGFDATSPEHHGLANGEIGRIWGYVDIYEDPLDSGKNALGRSNGFFVYSRGRLLNTDDAGFGIDRNLLRHGTFSRIRVVVHVDRLDEELRSSRESMREGEALVQTRHLLHGLFNFARTRLSEHQENQDPSTRLRRRLADSPASLADRPVIRAIAAAMQRGDILRSIQYPLGLEPSEIGSYVESLIERAEGEEGLIGEVALVDLSYDDPITVFDSKTGQLLINTLHPFVANFHDDFIDNKRNLPLELFAASEVVLEASLAQSEINPETVSSVLEERDRLLREIARTQGRTNSLAIANGLVESVHDKKALEGSVVAAFESLGFHAVPKGGKDNPDGLADAPIAARDGVPQRYRVSLEAKSKEKSVTRVRNEGVKVSTLARHRNDNSCDWSIVVGPDFSTTLGEESAVLREIAEDYEKYDGRRGITLIRATDLARLVRLAPLHRVTLSELRTLFETCRGPDEAAAWVEGIAKKQPEKLKIREILEMIWDEQKGDENEPVTYGALRSSLRRVHDLQLTDLELRGICQSLMRMDPKHVYANDERVELDMRPDVVLGTISAYARELGST